MTGSISGRQYYGNYQYSGYAQADAVRRDGQVSDAAAKRADLAGSAKQIQPVIGQSTGNYIPFLRKGADPAEMAVRMRMEYDGTVQPDSMKTADGENGIEGVQKALEEGKCKTCEERKYQDGSDDPGVSYQTPTRIAPGQAAAAVRGHEMEHVVRENAKAQREERKVVSQSVTLHTAICPECGKAYISGGTTRTTTAAKTQPEPARSEQPARTPFSAVA